MPSGRSSTAPHHITPTSRVGPTPTGPVPNQPLLRRYPTCGRVDIPGLPAGSYSVKIVAVDASGNETSAHGIAEGMTVTPLDRSGFAWK